MARFLAKKDSGDGEPGGISGELHFSNVR